MKSCLTDEEERRASKKESTEESQECFAARKALEKKEVRTAAKWMHDEVLEAHSQVLKLAVSAMENKDFAERIDFLHILRKFNYCQRSLGLE